MVAAFRKHLNRSPGPVIALAVAFVAALVAAMLPDWRLARLVVDSGLPAVLPPAAPPLGMTARLLFVVAAAGTAGAVTWATARYLLPVPQKPQATARRADAHPDAPLREPVKAMRDLGAPFLDTPVIERESAEQPVPGDLDQPMAAFDPAAIPETPQTPSAAVMPLYRPAPPNDPVPLRTRPVDAAPNGPRLWTETSGKPASLPSDATIDTMIERLEKGLNRRGRPLPGARAELDAVLATLRGIAARR